MQSLPEVTVVGTLTADPELRFTQSGRAVAGFSIACNSRKKDAGGNWVDGDTTFLRANIWAEYAENVAESLTKGTKVIARGTLKQRSFETKEGDKRTVFELEVDEIGPTLRFATAKVNRTPKGGNSGSSSSSGNGGGNWGSGDDEPGWG